MINWIKRLFTSCEHDWDLVSRRKIEVIGTKGYLADEYTIMTNVCKKCLKKKKIKV